MWPRRASDRRSRRVAALDDGAGRRSGRPPPRRRLAQDAEQRAEHLVAAAGDQAEPLRNAIADGSADRSGPGDHDEPTDQLGDSPILAAASSADRPAAGRQRSTSRRPAPSEPPGHQSAAASSGTRGCSLDVAPERPAATTAARALSTVASAGRRRRGTPRTRCGTQPRARQAASTAPLTGVVALAVGRCHQRASGRSVRAASRNPAADRQVVQRERGHHHIERPVGEGSIEHGPPRRRAGCRRRGPASPSTHRPPPRGRAGRDERR